MNLSSPGKDIHANKYADHFSDDSVNVTPETYQTLKKKDRLY